MRSWDTGQLQPLQLCWIQEPPPIQASLWTVLRRKKQTVITLAYLFISYSVNGDNVWVDAPDDSADIESSS